MKTPLSLFFRLVLVASLTVAAVFTTGASTILLDTFDTDGGSTDVNYKLTNRQSGAASPLNWLLGTNVSAAQIQVNAPAAPGRLRIDAINGQGMYNGVLAATYLNHNFTETTHFAIEFDMTLMAGTQWAAIVFGASTAPISVNLSDGIGVLFGRNNDEIQFFNGTAGNAFNSAQAGFPGGFPYTSGTHVRIEAAMSGAYGAAGTVTIKLFLDGNQVLLPGGAPTGEYVRNTSFAANRITLMGVAFNPGEEFVDTYDNFQITDLTPAVVALNIAPAAGGNAVLSWPASATGFGVQTNNVLTGGGWAVDTSLTPTVVGANNQVVVSAGNAAQFFRLVK